MDSYFVASVVFICVFTGSLLGLSLNTWLPDHHRSVRSHDAIKLGTGVIAVLASLVLGLLTAGIKSKFDVTDARMRGFASSLIMLDQTLRDYGPEANNARSLLRTYTADAIEDQWPQKAQQAVRSEDKEAGSALEGVRLAIVALDIDTPQHQMMRASAMSLADSVLHTRWLLIEQAEFSIQPVFLVVLIAWIVLIFVSFGYNAPANATVIGAFFICSAAIAACLFVIIDMDTPFDGLIVISSHAMRDALAHMSQ